MSDLPEWCQPPHVLAGRDQIVEDAVDATSVGPVTMVGPPGAGTTATAGAVAVRLQDLGEVSRLIAVRVDGCFNVSDVIRAVGYAMRLAMPGDAATVRSALRSGPRTAILFDDADLAPEAVRHALAITGDCPIIATGRDPVVGATIGVDPLEPGRMTAILPPGVSTHDLRGLPLLAVLPQGDDPVDPWSVIERVPEGAELLADIPMGLDDEGTQPSEALLPFLVPVRGRLVLRRAVRELLGVGVRPSAQTLTAVVRDRIPELHRIAADVDPLVSHEDIVLLRTAAEQILEPDLRSLAGAAAARMMIRAFQAPDALALTEVLLAIRLPPTARGLLRWVQGDAYVSLGSVVEAQASWQEASRALRSADRDDIVSALARSATARLLVRDDTKLAQAWMETLEDLAPNANNRVAFADKCRLAGHLARIADDPTEAVGRYAEASSALRSEGAPRRARACVAIARAATHIQRGDFARAGDQLNHAEEDGGDEPPTHAAIETLRAEIALRQGLPAVALASCDRATAGWRWTGDMESLARIQRIIGDAHALNGDRTAAIQAWREAIRLDVRVHNLPMTRACLLRIATVEAEGEPGPHVREADAQLSMAGGTRGSTAHGAR